MPDEKMKYPLLEFEYDKKLYEETFDAESVIRSSCE